MSTDPETNPYLDNELVQNFISPDNTVQNQQTITSAVERMYSLYKGNNGSYPQNATKFLNFCKSNNVNVKYFECSKYISSRKNNIQNVSNTSKTKRQVSNASDQLEQIFKRRSKTKYDINKLKQLEKPIVIKTKTNETDTIVYNGRDEIANLEKVTAKETKNDMQKDTIDYGGRTHICNLERIVKTQHVKEKSSIDLEKKEFNEEELEKKQCQSKVNDGIPDWHKNLNKISTQTNNNNKNDNNNSNVPAWCSPDFQMKGSNVKQKNAIVTNNNNDNKPKWCSSDFKMKKNNIAMVYKLIIECVNNDHITDTSIHSSAIKFDLANNAVFSCVLHICENKMKHYKIIDLKRDICNKWYNDPMIGINSKNKIGSLIHLNDFTINCNGNNLYQIKYNDLVSNYGKTFKANINFDQIDTNLYNNNNDDFDEYDEDDKYDEYDEDDEYDEYDEYDKYTCDIDKINKLEKEFLFLDELMSKQSIKINNVTSGSRLIATMLESKHKNNNNMRNEIAKLGFKTIDIEYNNNDIINLINNNKIRLNKCIATYTCDYGIGISLNIENLCNDTTIVFIPHGTVFEPMKLGTQPTVIGKFEKDSNEYVLSYLNETIDIQLIGFCANTSKSWPSDFGESMKLTYLNWDLPQDLPVTDANSEELSRSDINTAQHMVWAKFEKLLNRLDL